MPGVNYRHSLRKRRGPKCRRRSFLPTFFLLFLFLFVFSYVNACVCLSSFLFLFFSLFLHSYSCWGLCGDQANGSPYEEREQQQKQGMENLRCERGAKRKKRMTAIKQTNSSHLSSTPAFRLCMWKLWKVHRAKKRERTKGGSKLGATSFPRDIWDVESTLQHVTRERTSFSFSRWMMRTPTTVPYKSCPYPIVDDEVDVGHQRQPIICSQINNAPIDMKNFL